MSTITLEEINQVLKTAYRKEKRKARKRLIICKDLAKAWEFIDHLFALESKSRGMDYYDLLISVIPLLKPEDTQEESFVLMDYLSLLGIDDKNIYFDLIVQYYLDTHQPPINLELA